MEKRTSIIVQTLVEQKDGGLDLCDNWNRTQTTGLCPAGNQSEPEGERQESHIASPGVQEQPKNNRK